MARRAVFAETNAGKIGKVERENRIAVEAEWQRGQLADFAPTTLNEDGMTAFKIIVSAIPEDKLSMIDGYTIEIAANALARMAQANDDIERRGLTVTRHSKTGDYDAPNPNVAIYKTYSDIVKRFLVELGCTPSARAKIAADAAKQLSRPQGVRAKLNG